MDKILGLPRNAAIVIGAVIVSAIAMAVGLLMPWGNGSPAPEDSSAKAIVGGPPPPIPPASPPAGTAPAAPASPADSFLAGMQFKRITVDFDKLPGDQAMQAFSDAATLQVDQGGGAGPVDVSQFPVSMHLKNAPLLEGLLQLANNTRTMPQEITDTHATLRVMGDAAVGKWSVTGPFAVVIQRIQVTSDLTRPGTPGLQGLLFFDFYSDPAVKIAQYPVTLSFDQFEDEKHQVLFAGNSYGTSTGSRNLPRATLQLPMSLPAEHGRRVAVLRGSAMFTVALSTETVETSGPDDTVNKTVGEVGVEIMPLKPDTRQGAGVPNRMYTMSVRYHRRVADPEKWNRMINMLTRIQPQVLDAADNPLQGNFYTSNQDRQGEESITQFFNLQVYNQNPNAGEPHHVRFELPAEMREVRVPFDFRDLLLP